MMPAPADTMATRAQEVDGHQVLSFAGATEWPAWLERARTARDRA